MLFSKRMAFFVYICESMKNIIIYESCKGKKKKKKAHKTVLILTAIINNFKVPIMAVQLNVDQFVTPILTLVDSVTQQPVSATWSNVILTSSDTNIFTVDTDANADGSFDVWGVGEGVASLNIKATASYIDSNGKPQKQQKETDQAVEVLLPPANDTELVVTFTTPQ